MRASRLAAGVVLARLGAALWWWQQPRSHAPFFPQFRRQVVDKLNASVVFATHRDPHGTALVLSPPPMKKPAELPSAAAYRSAIAAGKDRPGARAFHADTDLFCEYNRKVVEEQARKEGITVAEVKELTFFGFAATRATQPSKVEEVLG